MSAEDLESMYFYEPFSATLAGFVVPMVTGVISACSSGLTIYIISKSPQKLSTTYHRIMAFMSTFDIMSSAFISLGTIMLPSDNIYKFAGPMLGNDTTCRIQGWLFVFGICGGTSLNASLSWYFVCKFTFKMDANKVARRVEPIMYTYTLLLSLFFPSIYLYNDLLHPNSYDNFCTIVPYPESCDEEKWYDWNYCTWSDGDLDDYFRYANIAVVVIGLQFSLIVFGMSIILWTTYKNSREIKSALLLVQQQNRINRHHHQNDTFSPSVSNTNDISEEQRNEEIKSTNHLTDLRYTRVLITQALMYIGAFFLTWIFTLLSGAFNIASFELDAINSVLFPLQGFWNLLIFLYDKTYLIRQRDRRSSSTRISLWQAFKQILASPSDTPTFVVSNISTVNMEPARDDDDDDDDDDNDLPFVEEETNESPRPPAHTSFESDILLSEIGSEYDDISDLRGEGYSSLQNSNSIDVNSAALSELGKVSSLEGNRREEMTNTRKSYMHMKKKDQVVNNPIHSTK